MNILIFGGDLRQIAAAKYFRTKGHEVTVFAIPKIVLSQYGAGDMATDSFVPTEVNIFPLPVSRDGININCPLSEKGYGFTETFRLFGQKNKIYVGMASAFQKSFFSELKLDITDYYDFEELQIKNAVPTAEGALSLFLSSLPVTVMDSRTAVLGYGRIGRALALRLKALGSRVTVCARSEKDLATAHIDGMDSMKISDYLISPIKTDCIFNTVPCRLFDEKSAKMTDRSLFIDLASAPYGVDDKAVNELGARYVRASSLPGKTAPVTAGRIIAGTILRHIEGGVSG